MIDIRKKLQDELNNIERELRVELPKVETTGVRPAAAQRLFSFL